MKREAHGSRDEAPSSEEIEILEVVGIGEDRAPVSKDEDDGEVVITFPEEAPAARIPPDEVRVEGEPADAEGRLLRLRADFENLRKRVEREREDYYRHATASFVARLLPVLDNLERALVSVRGGREADPLLSGVELIHRQFLDELRREGLRKVECLGLPFDPAVHEAVATRNDTELAANTVVEELQRGYHFEDRLLRPALVRVTVLVSHGEETAPSRRDS